MGFTYAKPYMSKLNKTQTGIRISYKKNKAGIFIVRLSLNKEVQKDLFESTVSGKMFNIEIGRGNDHGKLRINQSDKGVFKAVGSGYGSIVFTIEKWDTLPDVEHKPSDCFVESVNKGIIIELPKWAQVWRKADNGVSLP